MDDAADAIEELKRRNRTINVGENDGSAEVLKPLLCVGNENVSGEPLLAFRRASGKCEDAKTFLGTLKGGGERKILGETQVSLLGRHRALVTCVIDAGGKRYHNARIFVRADAASQDWRLLAWANEEI